MFHWFKFKIKGEDQYVICKAKFDYQVLSVTPKFLEYQGHIAVKKVEAFKNDDRYIVFESFTKFKEVVGSLPNNT